MVADDKGTYRDGYRAGWEKVTDRPIKHWPTMRSGYDRGLGDGQREAERMLRAMYPVPEKGD